MDEEVKVEGEAIEIPVEPEEIEAREEVESVEASEPSEDVADEVALPEFPLTNADA